MEIRRICVFCGAKPHVNDKFSRLAIKCGEQMANLGLTLVYGGGNTGLMGDISNAVLNNGGKVIGFYPIFLHNREPINPAITERYLVNNMFERKEGMFTNSDAFLILPGGIGTLDEAFEVITLKTHNQLDKPIVFVNQDGYWDKMIELLNHMIANKFVGQDVFNYFNVVSSLEEAFKIMGHTL